jgi:hypothetical protein
MEIAVENIQKTRSLRPAARVRNGTRRFVSYLGDGADDPPTSAAIR